ncbi:MAG TPA: asparagine synthase (glutamine-hydrolyzing) [Pyrinomonadaceae bacterium]|nr:asparagine synthase (glutamine-hydrolyzing) [Pyrinomonadaceae bacterium]
MCGIAGLVGNFEQRRGVAAVATMVSALAHRGPDGEGLEVWSSAILGHRRLSIFDLSGLGRQPMLSPDRKTAVVFNGAIYNFRELRAELENSGYRFLTQTDTEVLIHGHDAWGIDGLVAKIRGMFAFALWDEFRQKLFLVRDRLGVKPLIYANHNGSLAFASSVRALRLAGFVDDLDQDAVTEYLEFGYVTDDRSIYQGARKIPAATIVEWSNQGVTSRQYWKPPSIELSKKLAFEEVTEEAERLFVRAVERRLQADVRVGALLSGGVDSSLVCWAIAQLRSDIAAFTVGTPGDVGDETSDARATATFLGIDHHILNLSPDETPGLTELVSAYAEPFACASALGMLAVSQAVKREATVLVTGDGGDDVFLGYPEHRNLWFAQKFARSIPAGAGRLWLGLRESFPRRTLLKRLGSFVDYSIGGLGAVACAHDGLPVYQKYGLLGERLAQARISQRELPWSTESARNLMEEFLEYDRKTRFVGEYMTKVDGATMYHGLEARSPFLDQELWEFAASIPISLRLRHGGLKSVLRNIARRKLGERVATGPKRGFSIPVERWLAGRWRAKMAGLLRDSVLDREGWIRAAPALKLLNEVSPKGTAPSQLWYILVLESWLRFEKGEKPSFGSGHARTPEVGQPVSASKTPNASFPPAATDCLSPQP